MDVDEDEAADTSRENDAISVEDENRSASGSQDVESTNTDSAISLGPLKDEEPSGSLTKRKRTSDDSIVDEGDSQSCPICFDPWTTNGDHRLCSLKCGHLFGYNCVNRWLLLNVQDPRCPTCKDKAGMEDIRYIFARKVVAMDDLELTRMKKKLSNVNQEKNRLQAELATTTCQMHMLKQEVSEYKRKIAMFNQGGSHTGDKSAGEVSLYKEKTLELGKDSNCRVLDSKNILNMIAVPVKSTNNLCNGFGVKLINATNFKPTAFILLHSQMIRDVKFHETKPWLMTCSVDRDVKILDVHTNQTNLTLKACSPLWSCCWDIDNEHMLYAGQQQGSVLKFDIRKPTVAVQDLFAAGDFSPVVSVQAIAPSRSIFPLGGVISCKLTSIWGFENTGHEPRKHFLPVEGPFVSLTTHRNHNHLFVSSRPNPRYNYARHFLLELTKGDQVGCNIVHTFRGGHTQRMLSRTCLLSSTHDYAAAYIEDQRTVAIWNINNSNWVGSVPAQETVLDINSVRTANSDFLLTLTENKLRIFKFTNW